MCWIPANFQCSAFGSFILQKCYGLEEKNPPLFQNVRGEKNKIKNFFLIGENCMLESIWHLQTPLYHARVLYVRDVEQSFCENRYL